MGNFSVELMQSFDLIECFKCGVAFAVPTRLKTQLIATHENFWCPNGHVQHFVRETEAEKLQKQLAAEQQRRELAEADACHFAAEAEKAQRAKARIEKRVSAGVCPCCNRTFENLARHMATKHKEMPAAIAAAPARKLLQ